MVLTDWSRLLGMTDGYQAQEAATEENLARHEEKLNASFPGQLAKLYLVSDGVFDVRGRWFVIWPLTQLRRRNEFEWARGGPGRRDLLGFGDDGTGVTFCVPRNGGSGVFVWHPLITAPSWLANDVGDFWAGWTTGTITTSPAVF